MFKIIWKPKAARQIEKIKDSGTRKAIFKSIGRYRVFFNVVNSVQIVSIEEVKKRDESTY